ncbi:MAG: type II toxin-antitoxin system VapC family toxin [Rubrobacteraceae bacterium]
MNLLLDTNVCIYLIRQRPVEVLRRFEEHEVGEIGVSSITAAELYFGVRKSRYADQNAQALEQFLLPLEIAEFGFEAAVAYGGIRATLEKQGTPVGPLDTLIAAQAVSLGATLITNNTREFTRVPNLKLDNWVSDHA